MATYGTEDVPNTWDEARDPAFFRITAALFHSEFTYGAGVLLASYDALCEAPSPVVALPVATTSRPLLIG